MSLNKLLTCINLDLDLFPIIKSQKNGKYFKNLKYQGYSQKDPKKNRSSLKAISGRVVEVIKK